GLGLPGIALGAAVAGVAALDVLRELHRRPVVDAAAEPDDAIAAASDDARQLGAAVDLVDHHAEVDGVAGVGIARLLGVAQHALLDLRVAAAVRGEAAVA